jgi:ADP-ribose pyrophosphatase YjhB (NUDIX family)
VNQTPAECVIREIEEESGYAARVIKLAAVWDRARQGHPPGLFSIVKMFFVCALAGGTARTGLETNGVSWFLEHELPSELSMGRVLPHQLARMFAHWHQPAIATEFN